MGNVCKYTLERPFGLRPLAFASGPKALCTEHMDDICKYTRYTKYEQFGIVVIDFINRDVIACYTKETGVILLYKTKQDNCSKKTFPKGYLGKYKTIYYKPSFGNAGEAETDGILMSTSCFGIN